ncbi:MAG TPA: helix-turn-helix domain-containing protein [Arachidicoccus soli]|uniref:DNA-binding protein n=1 Tax=Arachidicoccus soli TaxID=2341117 RepID=A0A386HTE0_9BACT|nr:helix-turn-helix domain-containing protein [Arachidicoccus soli]AYD49083.1 DNA-binding protein [Arachidicoccus soli]HEU0228190.1 helix-turn-helix domain-containing protein [Arachidicoccus soli]
MSGIIISVDKAELENLISHAIVAAFDKAGVSKQRETESILDIDGVQKYLSMKRSSIYQKTHKKEIPHYKKGKALYFLKEELDQWVRQGRRPMKGEIDPEKEMLITRRFKNIQK